MTTKPLMVQTPKEQQESVSAIMGTKKPEIKSEPVTVEPPKTPRVEMETVEITASKPKTNDQARTDAVKKAMDK